MPSLRCTVVAVAGKVWSGVEVATTIRSRSLRPTPGPRQGLRARRRPRGRRSARPRRRGGAGRCRCARGSTRRRCRPAAKLVVASPRAPAGRRRRRSTTDLSITVRRPPRAWPAPAAGLIAPISSMILSIGALADEVDRDADRGGEADGVGAAVALHHDAVQAEEHGAVVAPRIELARAACRRRAWPAGSRAGPQSAAAEGLAQGRGRTWRPCPRRSSARRCR